MPVERDHRLLAAILLKLPQANSKHEAKIAGKTSGASGYQGSLAYKFLSKIFVFSLLPGTSTEEMAFSVREMLWRKRFMNWKKAAFFVLVVCWNALPILAQVPQIPATRPLANGGLGNTYQGPGDIAPPWLPGALVGQNPTMNPVASVFPLPGNACTNLNPSVAANTPGGFQFLGSACVIPPHINCKSETDCTSSTPIPGADTLPPKFPVMTKSWGLTIQDAQTLVNNFSSTGGAVNLTIPVSTLGQDVFIYESWLLTKLNVYIPDQPTLNIPAVPISACLKADCGYTQVISNAPVNYVNKTFICPCEQMISITITIDINALQYTLWWVQASQAFPSNTWLFQVDVLGCNDC